MRSRSTCSPFTAHACRAPGHVGNPTPGDVPTWAGEHDRHQRLDGIHQSTGYRARQSTHKLPIPGRGAWSWAISSGAGLEMPAPGRFSASPTCHRSSCRCHETAWSRSQALRSGAAGDQHKDMAGHIYMSLALLAHHGMSGRRRCTTCSR